MPVFGHYKLDAVKTKLLNYSIAEDKNFKCKSSHCITFSQALTQCEILSRVLQKMWVCQHAEQQLAVPATTQSVF